MWKEEEGERTFGEHTVVTVRACDADEALFAYVVSSRVGGGGGLGVVSNNAGDGAESEDSSGGETHRESLQRMELSE